jgi:alginate O-acetyltransferase complex protein AlgI
VNFNQPEYAVFLFVVFWAFWGLRRRVSLREALLLVASYVFYSAWNPRYLALLAFSTLVDYFVAKAIARSEDPLTRKVLLVVSLCVSLLLLGTFKYYNFFSTEIASALSHLGIRVRPAHLDVLLPAGISFYTFQTMNYVIDVYRRKLEPARSLLEFAVFVSFFPHLVAGPILRASTFIPQLEPEPSYDHTVGLRAVSRILRGLAKKALFADYVGQTLVDPIFRHLSTRSSASIAIALYGYAVQIYSDFSGYSDIAIGSALLLGFKIPENFDHPYLSRNPREFWTRWHISLSTWLRDYLYIPLGGSRQGAFRAYRNLLIVMLRGGLWHGANWTFVVWGGLHGLALVVHRAWASRTGASQDATPDWICRLAFFHFTCLTWLFFRADSLGDAARALARLGTFTTGLELDADARMAVCLVALALLLHFADGSWKARLQERFVTLGTPAQALVAAAVILLVAGLSALGRPFIYFQF